jgi:hypothetical protein
VIHRGEILPFATKKNKSKFWTQQAVEFGAVL